MPLLIDANGRGGWVRVEVGLTWDPPPGNFSKTCL